MRQNTNRTQGISDQELDLQRRGQARHYTVEQREAMAYGFELAGFDVAARRLRDLNDCLTRRARVEVVPDDGRKPLKSTTDRPLLVALDGENAADAEPVAPAALAWSRVAVAAEGGLATPGLGLLDAEELARLARASRELAQVHLQRRRRD